jgi:Rad3-related DNA helicase
MLALMVRAHARAARASFTVDDEASLQERIETWKDLSPETREQRLVEVINATLSEFYRQEDPCLPKIGLLVVDEAHQLEQWFASMNSLQVSVASIVKALKELRAAHSKV